MITDKPYVETRKYMTVGVKVSQILKDDPTTTIAEACRQIGGNPAQFHEWKLKTKNGTVENPPSSARPPQKKKSSVKKHVAYIDLEPAPVEAPALELKKELNNPFVTIIRCQLGDLATILKEL